MGKKKKEIKTALQTMDHEDGSLWCKDGLPKMSVIEKLVGDKSITRQDVTDADPEFCRDAAKVEAITKVLDDELADENDAEEVDNELEALELEPKKQCSTCGHRPGIRCLNSGQIMKDNDHCSQFKA